MGLHRLGATPHQEVSNINHNIAIFTIKIQTLSYFFTERSLGAP